MPPASLDRRSLLAMFAGTSAAALGSGWMGRLSAAEASLDADGLSPDGNIQLQIIGSLGVGHIQSCLGFIGVIADSLSRDIYAQRQVEDLMQGTINGLELPKKMLRRLQDGNISDEDKEFLDRMIGVFNALQREANTLILYSRSRKVEDAQKFERDRRTVLKKLSDLTQQEELDPSDTVPQERQWPQIDSNPRTVPNSNSKNRTGQIDQSLR